VTINQPAPTWAVEHEQDGAVVYHRWQVSDDVSVSRRDYLSADGITSDPVGIFVAVPTAAILGMHEFGPDAAERFANDILRAVEIARSEKPPARQAPFAETMAAGACRLSRCAHVQRRRPRGRARAMAGR
jgi:hypothetical protein